MASAWLPLLNSHKHSDLHVRIQESLPPEHFHRNRKFRFVATVDIVFYSKDGATGMRTAYRGLSNWKSQLIDVGNRETLAASLQGNFLDDGGFVPFPLSPCLWSQEHYDSGRWSPPLRISRRDELVRRVSDFVALADGRPSNKKVMLVEARLEITKFVEVAAEGIAAWTAWFDEQMNVRRNFAVEYLRALTRQPEEEACCAICLEEFGRSVAVLPCLHAFHVDCISTWLEGSCICPLCRCLLPPAAQDDVV